ncbi:MAG: carbohydrate ABC transporter substrate-binding protein [Vitreoscilla sp.]|nr:carbohydrate ABC transporter substrate-binding protein [Vitreoscilla sp.]MBP6674626.1 carbohydrate ABC transporter substrate-binding protein [Vitreoscilla sp.]
MLRLVDFKRCALAALLAGLIPCVPAQTATPPETLQVLHWWTSASERKAANVLASRLAEEGVTWQDAAIPGGAGLGAGKVLRSRVLAGQAPEVTQIIGESIKEWAGIGLLLEFDNVAVAGRWAQVLSPTVYALVQHRGHVVAAPLGVHRINTLFYNRPLLERLGLKPPANWAEFAAMAPRLKAAGAVPLAQSAEPWQVATLFENLVLAEGGPALHRELFVRQSEAALADKRLVLALQRLRTLKAWMSPTVQERPWTDLVRQVQRGEAAMLVMGDWAKGELLESGAVIDGGFGCAPAPGTASYHLYSVDTLTMFAGDYTHTDAQQKLARIAVQPAVQAEYNAVKGSVSVRRDADLSKMDACARDSWTAFMQGAAQQAPSLAHRMATDETRKDVIVAEIHRYFLDDKATPADAQQRLGAIFRALRLRSGQKAAATNP